MIKDHNIGNDAQIQDFKIATVGSTGRKKVYVGTSGTASYNLAKTRVPQADLFTTIDAANNALTASRGDIIEVLEYHAETITSAGAITLDLAGVKVLGMGIGESRPKITFTSTDNSASIVFTGAGVAFKNIICICGDDGLTNPIHMQAAGLDIDIEWRDASAAVEAAFVCVGTADANNLTLRYKHRGFIAGNAGDAAIVLDGSTGAEIDLDVYGVWTTAVVEFNDTAVVDVNVRGFFHNDGTTDFSKTVVDTATGSAWSVRGYDGDAESSFSGGPGGIAGDDVGTVTSKTDSVGLTASTTNSKVDSVSTRVSSGISTSASVGVQVSTVQSKADSVGLTASTSNSKVDSVGAAAVSKVNSVGTGGSTGISTSQSVGIQVSTSTSKVDSTGIAVSTAISAAGSVGVQTSTVDSKLESLALIISTINSKT